MSSQSVYRCDISTLRPVERRPDGTIRVDAFLSKCGVFPYVQPDGSIRRELRLREDVQDSESLRSFEGVPVTNNHPPGMIDAKNARRYSVGALIDSPVPDSDHIRGRLAIHDADTVADMESGKLQVSNGYTCDTVETPGVHPMYGPYDAIQKNIRGNHVAIVDRARAGITASARMDSAGSIKLEPGWEAVLQPGMQVAVDTPAPAWHSSRMPQSNARIEVVVKNDAAQPSGSAKIDPEDLASRNAAGETSAKPSKKEQPGESYEDDGGDRAKPRKGKPDPDEDDDADDDDDVEDAMYDEDGGLTKAGEAKVASKTYAVPGKKQLPLHDAQAVKDAMKAFPKHPFDDADQKHGAFNRIKGKALAFGMKDDATRFESKHGGKLDRADGAHKDDAMSTQDMKALEEKAAKRKEKLVAAKARIDALEIELAEKDALIENMKRDAASTKDASKKDVEAPRLDATEVQKQVDAKIELLDKARQTGAKVESKMADVEIMRATIKHVDGEDVPEPKQKDASYVQALFDGACKRSKKDATDADKGNAALAAARAAVETGRSNTHMDAGTDEDEAKAKLRAANRELINQPSKNRVAAR